MKSRLHRIEILNFKAFREFILNIESRHLLIYGPNGSGKSSLYWALYTFLQSANKNQSEVSKYFDYSHPDNLLNIHEDDSVSPGRISLTLRDIDANETVYRIGRTIHDAHNQPAIIKGDLASDFITYRFFFGFSHFRNSEKFDLWPLFEKEILPFSVSTSSHTPLQMWNAIKGGKPNPHKMGGIGGANTYKAFKQITNDFAAILSGIVDVISVEAQNFYNTHFSHGDPAAITLKLALVTPPSFTGTNVSNSKFSLPVLEFGIQVDRKSIKRPQSFLNEAKLTQLALSIRFAASLVNLHDSDLKLLVLDDLLVSLDMSNRMKVVNILLSDTFASYQKIVLTHDHGFFHEFRRKIGATHSEWGFFHLVGSSNRRIEAKSEKTDIQKAEEYLHGHNLDEAALCLRKAAEDTALRFINRNNSVNPTKTFVSLTQALRTARNNISSELPVQLYEKILRNTPDAHRNLLVATNEDDLESNPSLDPATKGRLKTNRRRLRCLVEMEHVERMRQIKLIDDILACTERVLNPAAHANNPPLYEQEVQNALNLIQQLETTLNI
jgi:energy-coupling factor transporter ATP-binding protein EcfA2